MGLSLTQDVKLLKNPLILGDRDRSTSSTKACKEFNFLLYSRLPAVFMRDSPARTAAKMPSPSFLSHEGNLHYFCW